MRSRRRFTVMPAPAVQLTHPSNVHPDLKQSEDNQAQQKKF